MPNTTEGRRRVRAQALEELLDAVRRIAPPDGKTPGWITEFTRAAASICRTLENQLAQAAGDVFPRRKRGQRFDRDKGGPPRR